MGKFVCEMCGNNNLVKQDGMYVCEYCGTRYSPEEAKKLITVKIDKTDEVNNLYQLARRARDSHDSDNAQKYYEMILLKEPDNWEAAFFSAYYKACNCKIAEITNASLTFSESLNPVCQLINNIDDSLKANAISVVSDYSIDLSTMMFNATVNNYKNIDINIRSNFAQKTVNDCISAIIISNTLGDCINDVFIDEELKKLAVNGWKHAMKLNNTPLYRNFTIKKNAVSDYQRKIALFDVELAKQLELEQRPSTTNNKSGCYVATAVYGSYDCPQVWTLRRYRDYRLDSTWYGRLFIMLYYAISPTLVKWFGHTNWFKKMWKGKLDRMVERLKAEGYEDTPYNDKY